ncbi:hypothetical protein AYO21_11695 [Fonsecaea monophora]|uniref:FAD/NAD(P)-binding domain-containing protein n=1 Tax=Fonsecaea monophora TaxID=254056 RepID=A0A177EQ95_9EURO|nr:hypothetical protein AYO21_11695 [Fonsecaea monophora]OAG34163.1 hypothetical protein AYO21_11695 [Fonsecaea monophora]
MGSMDTRSTWTWDDMVQNKPVDEARPIRVICIGAGASGICAGIRFPQKIKNLNLTIYEKNADVGGTWFVNKYPGLRCDIPSPGYQFTFESNSQWSEFYASGPEIQRYLQNVAKKYGVYDYCKFKHQFVSATWHEDQCEWEVVFEDLEAKKKVIDRADIVVTATGILDKWEWPDIEGLHDFKGKLVHTADWDPSIQLHKDLRVALVGAGSSGVQLLPTLQPLVGHVDHYMKGRNWIAPVGFGGEEIAARGEYGNFKHPKDELERFRKVPNAYKEFRERIENSLNQAQLAIFTGTEVQKQFHQMCYDSMTEKLKDRPDILNTLLPDFPVGCRRLTPGPGYLEACLADNVDFIGMPIKKVHEHGIETADGKIREIDLLICATGYDVSRQGELPFVGQGGITLDEVWNPIPEAYLSMCPPKMPNLLMFLGPNGGPGTGGTIFMIENVCDYMTKMIQKVQREYIRSFVVKEAANKAFSAHVDRYFSKTVFTAPCKSWYKRGQPNGRLVTPWPGSGVHARKALQEVCYEDFDYEYHPVTKENKFAWLGDGLTYGQQYGPKAVDYLDDIDYPAVKDATVDTGVPAV